MQLAGGAGRTWGACRGLGVRPHLPPSAALGASIRRRFFGLLGVGVGVVDVAGSGAVPGSGSTMGAGRFWPAVAAEPTEIEGIYIRSRSPFSIYAAWSRLLQREG